jgi:hypothetical protein
MNRSRRSSCEVERVEFDPNIPQRFEVDAGTDPSGTPTEALPEKTDITFSESGVT